jgi:hypothetical protein
LRRLSPVGELKNSRIGASLREFFAFEAVIHSANGGTAEIRISMMTLFLIQPCR